MPSDPSTERQLLAYADANRAELVSTLQQLVRTPSENTPPTGAEAACQRYCAEKLRAAGYEPDLYEPSAVPGLLGHLLYRPGRDYRNRPNLAARKPGAGGGRSLILSGHVDTVPAGALPWTRDPFCADVEDGRLYGRGSNDMKAGIAANLFVARALAELRIPLRGDLTLESVVDEEFGGVNGTLAGRLRGYLADAAVVSEPTSLRICPAQRGGRTAHIGLSVPGGGILAAGMESGVAAPLAWLLSQVPAFAQSRRAAAPGHPLYAHLPNPVPVSVLKVSTGPWSMKEPMATATACQIELFWQTMPGETREAVDDQFHAWLDGLVRARPELFPVAPTVGFPLEWLPGAATQDGEALVSELRAAAVDAGIAEPAVHGIEGPCDMFVFNQAFGIPAALWGVSGGNTHGADEWVDLESVHAAARALLLFVYRWCA